MKTTLFKIFLLAIIYFQTFLIYSKTSINFIKNDTIIKKESNDSFEYKAGVYGTFENFKNKTATSSGFDFDVKVGESKIAYRFTDKLIGDKLKKVFAVCDGENLYINIKMMMMMFDKESKDQAYDGGDYFLKVKNIGGYIYVEDYFTSNEAGLFGGLTGSLAARRIKGVIYIEKDQKFKLFKNYKKFGEFINKNHPELIEEHSSLEKDQMEEHLKVKKVLSKIQ